MFSATLFNGRGDRSTPIALIRPLLCQASPQIVQAVEDACFAFLAYSRTLGTFDAKAPEALDLALHVVGDDNPAYRRKYPQKHFSSAETADS